MNLPALIAYARKSLATLVGGVIAWASISLPDQHVSFSEWISLAVVIATALGVYHVSNDDLPTKAAASAPAPEPAQPPAP